MGLAEWWIDFRLERVNRKLKGVHHKQKQLRDRAADLKKQHAAGKVTDDEFEAKNAKLVEERSALADDVSQLNERADELKRERQARSTAG